MSKSFKLPKTGWVKDDPLRDSPLVTPWMPADSKPMRTGLYQVIEPRSGYASDAYDEILWCWFDAAIGAWGWAYYHKRDAMSKQWRNPEGATQRRQWRGLSKPL